MQQVQMARESLKESGLLKISFSALKFFSYSSHQSTNAKLCAPNCFSCRPVLQVRNHPKLKPKRTNDIAEIELQSAFETKSLEDARLRRGSILAARDAAAAAHVLVEAELSNAEATLAGICRS